MIVPLSISLTDAPKVISIVIEPFAESDIGKIEKYIVVKDFKMTKEVKDRMTKLCGTTNFSLALRNSEHVARYELFKYVLILTCSIARNSKEPKTKKIEIL
jgi:hypothetical protein